MNYSVDDLLYAFMTYHATFDPDTQEYYLTERNWTKYRPLLKSVISTRNCRNHLNSLIQKEIIIYDKERMRYIFPHNGFKKYQQVNNSMLYYLIITSNINVIKIYIYLLNKWLWKKQTKEPYYFTLKELREALGYSGSDNAGVDSALHTILFSIAKWGIIDATPTYLSLNPKTPPSPVYQLDFVAQSPREFRNISTEKASLLAAKNGDIKKINDKKLTNNVKKS
jgi:hypothetical protein